MPSLFSFIDQDHNTYKPLRPVISMSKPPYVILSKKHVFFFFFFSFSATKLWVPKYCDCTEIMIPKHPRTFGPSKNICSSSHQMWEKRKNYTQVLAKHPNTFLAETSPWTSQALSKRFGNFTMPLLIMTISDTHLKVLQTTLLSQVTQAIAITRR